MNDGCNPASQDLCLKIVESVASVKCNDILRATFTVHLVLGWQNSLTTWFPEDREASSGHHAASIPRDAGSSL